MNRAIPTGLYSLAVSISDSQAGSNTTTVPPPSILKPISPTSPSAASTSFSSPPTRPRSLSQRQLSKSSQDSLLTLNDTAATDSLTVGRVGEITMDYVDFPDKIDEEEHPASPLQIHPLIATATPNMSSFQLQPAVATYLGPKKSGTTVLSNMGTIHLYRHTPLVKDDGDDAGTVRDTLRALEDSAADGQASTSAAATTTTAVTGHENEEGSDGTLVAVLACPSWWTPADFLRYVGPAESEMKLLRMIRDVSPTRSVVLIKFRTREFTEEFMEIYNGRQFTPMQPEVAHVVPILKVITHYTSMPLIEPSATTTTSTRATTPAFPAFYGTTELPTCPVCLERMDQSVTGLITIPCDHSFHCSCLQKWGDSRCPVCRYSQNPHLPINPQIPSSSAGAAQQPSTVARPSSCSNCDAVEQLWICLICGHLGCGRYREKHAQAHFEQSGHLYSLEVETQRVWNYAADEYVHRLIQDKANGKLVELPAPSSTPSSPKRRSLNLDGAHEPLPAAKLEAISLEYSHLLSSQLTQQREYYDTTVESLQYRIRQLEDERDNSSNRWGAKDKEKLRLTQKELASEKSINEGLMSRLRDMSAKLSAAEKDKQQLVEKVNDAEEQVRDLMFFVESREKINANEGLKSELAGGSVSLPTASPQPTPPKKKKGKK